MAGATSSESSDTDHEHHSRLLPRSLGMRRRQGRARLEPTSPSYLPQSQKDARLGRALQSVQTQPNLAGVTREGSQNTFEQARMNTSAIPVPRPQTGAALGTTVTQGCTSPAVDAKTHDAQNPCVTSVHTTTASIVTAPQSALSSSTCNFGSERPAKAASAGSCSSPMPLSRSSLSSTSSRLASPSFKPSSELSNKGAMALAGRSQPNPPSSSTALPPVPQSSHSRDNPTSRLSPGQETVSSAQGGASSSSPGSRLILEEIITAVRVPMLRPNLHLLQVIRSAGGTGEVFTLIQIIEHVKEYIGQRFMYDQHDPRIVYCDGDLLGKALGVKQFTISQAVGLFHSNCTIVRDSCVHISRHVETRPESQLNGSGPGNRENNNPATTESSVTVPESVSAPDSSSSCHTARRAPAHSEPLTFSTPRSPANDRATPVAMEEPATSTTDDSSMMPSTPASQESSSVFSQTDVSSQDIGPSVSQTELTDLSQPSSSSQPTSSFASSAPSTSAVISFEAAKSSVTLSDYDLKSGEISQQSSTDSSSDRWRQKPFKRKATGGGTGTSINVQLDEPDGDAGPWGCRVRVKKSCNNVDNAQGDAEDETLVVEYESDTFSVEYDVASSTDEMEGGQEEQRSEVKDGSCRARSVSENSSHSSGLDIGTAMLVVCEESDVEYLADYSDTDTGSDAELSDADKWLCAYCNVKNPPFQRNCGGCWSVRSDWLPSTINHEARQLANSDSEKKETAILSSDKKGTEKAGKDRGKSFSGKKDSKVDASTLQESSHDSSSLSPPDFVATSRGVKGGAKSEAAMEMKADSPEGKSLPSRKRPVTRPGKQRPASLYSARTLGALSRNEACVVCLTRPKTASIIHGKTGHQVCCYRCAKKLKKQRSACPICRRPIQKVVRNYHV